MSARPPPRQAFWAARAASMNGTNVRPTTFFEPMDNHNLMYLMNYFVQSFVLRIELQSRLLAPDYSSLP
jgi:hypothetical protein